MKSSTLGDNVIIVLSALHNSLIIIACHQNILKRVMADIPAC